MKQMNVIGDDSIKDIATFNYFYKNFNQKATGGALTEEEARDNFFREQKVEDDFKNKKKWKS